jgi:hypothetical protein
MPTVDIEENITQLRSSIEKMTQEVFRLQGMLSTFEGFKRGGLENIDLPNDPNQPDPEPPKKPKDNIRTTDINDPAVMAAEADAKKKMASPGNDQNQGVVDAIMTNPSLMAAAMSAMTNSTTPGDVPNQTPPDEQVESVQEKPE